MDFAASEAKKRGQSFPKTAVNLRRKRPGTDQPCPIMRPAPAGRSGPGSFQGHRSILQGRKNFSPLRGAIRVQRLWICPARSHAAGTEKMPICRAANLRGAICAQRLWMCPTRSHAAGTEKTPHLPGSQPAGSNSRTKAMDMSRPASAEGQRRKTKKAPGSDAFLLGADNRT